MGGSGETAGLLETARALLEQGRSAEALEPLRAAHEREPANACVRSYYGLSLGLAERCFEKAFGLCDAAVKQEFFNPDLYLNLATLHLAFGFKSEGLRYLRRGRMIDPAHAGIERALTRLGRRGAPVLRFLPRSHRLNRWLGRGRSLLRRGAAAHDALRPAGVLRSGAGSG